MSTRHDDGSQQSMRVATADLPQSAGHPFYARLNHNSERGRPRRVRRSTVRAVLRDHRAADLLSLRPCLHLASLDHSMISRTRRMFSVETHQAVSTSTQRQSVTYKMP